jgi:hypothetical protein
MSTSETIKLEKATLCFQGELGFSYQVVQACDITIEIKPWAQYENAVHVTFIPKGNRKHREIVQAYAPSLVVLKDHVKVNVPPAWGARAARVSNTSCAPVWGNEFQEALHKARQAGAHVVRDFRLHQIAPRISY